MHDLLNIAKESRKQFIRKYGKVITGYCYNSAEIVSKKLFRDNIDHDLYKVGIIEDYLQNSNLNRTQFIKANKKGKYDKGIPSTTEELEDEFTHYFVTANINNKEILVEPCTEIRKKITGIYISSDNGIHSRMYVGTWPEESYLRLKDSKMKKENRFKHFTKI